MHTSMHRHMHTPKGSKGSVDSKPSTYAYAYEPTPLPRSHTAHTAHTAPAAPAAPIPGCSGSGLGGAGGAVFPGDLSKLVGRGDGSLLSVKCTGIAVFVKHDLLQDVRILR
jgi:hypothetical protein